MSDLVFPKPQRPLKKRKRPSRARRARPGRPTLKQLDDLARPLCRNRPGGCEAASYLPYGPTGGCSNIYDWAHVLSRTYKTAVRWAPENCLKLCKAHHMYFTPRPVEWRRFLLFKIGEANLLCLEERALRELREKADRASVLDNLSTIKGDYLPNRLVIHP